MICPRCDGTGGEHIIEDGRLVFDACYYCGNTGITNKTPAQVAADNEARNKVDAEIAYERYLERNGGLDPELEHFSDMMEYMTDEDIKVESDRLAKRTYFK